MFRRLFRNRKPTKTTLVPPQELATWIESQVRVQVPRALIYQQLVAMQLDTDNPTLYQAAANDVMAIMFMRNHRGTRQELNGQTAAAIAEYEANVQDLYGEGYPYNRLRLLYEQRHEYEKAIRVCEAYLRLPESLAAPHKEAFHFALQHLHNKLKPQDRV